jgi:hypothetical protein
VTPTWYLRTAIQAAVGRGADVECFVLGLESIKAYERELHTLTPRGREDAGPRNFMGVPILASLCAQREAIECYMRPKFGSIEVAVLR